MDDDDDPRRSARRLRSSEQIDHMRFGEARSRSRVARLAARLGRAQRHRGLAAAHRDRRRRRAPDDGADDALAAAAAQAAEAARGHLGHHGLGCAVLLRVDSEDRPARPASPATASKRWERTGTPDADTRDAGLLIPIMALFYKDLTNRYMNLEAEGMKRAAELARRAPRRSTTTRTGASAPPRSRRRPHRPP